LLPQQEELRLNERIEKQGGFSLIEVLIAVVFLAIGVLAMAGLQVTSVRGNYFSNNLMQATYVAQDRLEFLKNLPFNSPQLDANNHNDGNTTVSGVVFNRSYTIVDNVNGYKRITYVVTWNDGVGHNITFSTVRSQ
jgi:type IV pilus assembly protein PilV